MDYRKVCRCKNCGKIYPKKLPGICKKCGTKISRSPNFIEAIMGREKMFTENCEEIIAKRKLFGWSVKDEVKKLAPVTTGEWIDTGSGTECSKCGEIQYGYDNYRHYCANCGARMTNVCMRRE